MDKAIYLRVPCRIFHTSSSLPSGFSVSFLSSPSSCRMVSGKLIKLSSSTLISFNLFIIFSIPRSSAWAMLLSTSSHARLAELSVSRSVGGISVSYRHSSLILSRFLVSYRYYELYQINYEEIHNKVNLPPDLPCRRAACPFNIVFQTSPFIVVVGYSLPHEILCVLVSLP